jgi:hypothetical protein
MLENAQPKPRPRALETRDGRRAGTLRKRKVYAAVDLRDQKRCRCCARRGDLSAVDTLSRLHRAHLRDASLGGGLVASNLATLCYLCHALVHAKQLWFLGDDASVGARPPLQFEIHEAAVVEVFGPRELPPHVHIVAAPRSAGTTP